MDKTVRYGLLALLLWSPLPAASVEAWAVFVIELAAAVLAAAYLLLEPKPELNRHLRPALKPMRFFTAAFFAFIALQIAPLPVGVVRALSPASYEFQKLYSPGFGARKLASLSIVPAATLRQGLFLAACFILGALVLKTVVRGRSIRALITVIVCSGVFQAFYGFFELHRAQPRLLFYKKVFHPDVVTGTFVNPNHFAGYLEMVVPLALGLVLARTNLSGFDADGFREKFHLWTSKDGLANVLILLAVVVMSLGIVMSNSRSGLAVLGLIAVLFLGLSIFSYARTGGRRPWIGKSIQVTVLVVTALAIYLGLGSTFKRFARESVLGDARSVYWSNAAGIVRDFPVFGTGLGTFASVYGAYEKQAGRAETRLDHAHNDYLEYAAEIGFAGAAVLLGGVLYLVSRAVLVWRTRKDMQARGLALGGFVSLAAIGVHACTDFNLHIPAVMVLFAVTLSLTVVMAFYRKT